MRIHVPTAVMVVFLSVGTALPAPPGHALPTRVPEAPDSQIDTILRENALYYGIITGIGITLSISDPLFGLDVDDINMNLITREVRDGSGKQEVVFRLGGVVRSNNNVEMNLLDPAGAPLGRLFYGFRSGDLLFYDAYERLILRGFIDYQGSFSLSDLRLPKDQQLLISGRFLWCRGCPGFDYSWHDGQGALLARGFIFFWPIGSFLNGIDGIRVGWISEGGDLEEGVPTRIDAEYDMKKEATGALNSNLFDRRLDAGSFFRHPFDLRTPPPGLAWLPRVTEETTLSLRNGSTEEARISLTARHFDGTLLRGEGIVNPITYAFNAGLQIAAFPREYLRGFSNSDHRPVIQVGDLPIWIEVTGDHPGLEVLSYDSFQNEMDGIQATQTPHKRFVISDLGIGPDMQHEVSMLNLSHDDTLVDVDAYDSDGRFAGSASGFYIPARGFRNFVLGNFPELFPGLDVSRVSTIHVQAERPGTGLATSVLSRGARGSLQIERDRDPAEASRVLFAPFFVTGGDPSNRWTTHISLTSVTGQSASVLVEIFTADGTLLASRNQFLRGRAGFVFKIGELLEETPKSLVRGYLRIESTVGLLGSVSFRYDSLEGAAASVLAMPASPANRWRILQVAHGPQEISDFYTGLVLLNPMEDTARVTVQAVDSEGRQTARAVVLIPPRSSKIDLLDGIFGARFSQLGGSLEIESSSPVFSQALFGNRSGTLLSAIPAVGLAQPQ